VNDVLEMMWKEAEVSHFKEFFQHFCGGAEKN
jgi:hypothetical protein